MVAVVLLATLWLVGWGSGRRLVYNRTDSEPRGWYLTKPVSQPLARGELVLFPVPAHVAGLVAGRRWLPPHVPLLKQVGAVAGDQVCVDTVLTIRGEVVGPVLSRDTAGRPLPAVRRGCFTVSPGSIFPVSTSLGNSFDARYFGEIPTQAVEATAVPLWPSPERGLAVVVTVLIVYFAAGLLFAVAWGLSCVAPDGDFPGLVPAMRIWWRRLRHGRAGDRPRYAFASSRRAWKREMAAAPRVWK